MVVEMKKVSVQSKNCVIYARVSSKEQEKEGFSIPSQLKSLNVYADKEGFNIIREYIDVETAKRSGRTYFNEMVSFLKKNSYSLKPHVLLRNSCTALRFLWLRTI